MDPTIENPSIEDDTASTNGAPPRRGVSVALVAVIAGAALVLGGIVGAAIGWKVEQNRVEDDVKNIRPVGTVMAITDDSLTVRLDTGAGRRVYALTDATVVDLAANGTTTDIEEGSTVFVRTRRASNGDLEAAQVVVLPEEVPASDQ